MADVDLGDAGELRAERLHQSIYGLQEHDALASASTTFTGLQRRSALGALGIYALVFALFPKTVAVWSVGVMMVIYLLTLVDRIRLFGTGLLTRDILTVSDEEALAIDDEDLPVYTVLLPAFHEPNIVPDLVRGVGKLAYPRDRLDVKLLLEADDEHTVRAAIDSDLTEHFEIILVPAAEPRTKPKACNYGLLDAFGSIVTIYDAEDIPDPLQLRRVVVAFSRLPDDVACIQAKLVYYNDTQNLLTRWFTSEYDQWFGYVLPGLMSLKAQFPSGGPRTTSGVRCSPMLVGGTPSTSPRMPTSGSA